MATSISRAEYEFLIFPLSLFFCLSGTDGAHLPFPFPPLNSFPLSSGTNETRGVARGLGGHAAGRVGADVHHRRGVHGRRHAAGTKQPLGRWAVGPLGRWAVGPLGRWAVGPWAGGTFWVVFGGKLGGSGPKGSRRETPRPFCWAGRRRKFVALSFLIFGAKGRFQFMHPQEGLPFLAITGWVRQSGMCMDPIHQAKYAA